MKTILLSIRVGEMRSDTGTREQFEYHAISVAGVRPVNEDAWCIAPVDGGLACAVADGIGGHEAGDVASALAIRIFRETIQEAGLTAGDPETAAAILKQAHTLAHEAIREQATGNRSGMGTTFVSACFGNGMVSLCNTGDSRCTLIRAGTVCSLTKDHSFVQSLVDREVITQEEALTHPMKHIITHSLGADFAADCTSHRLLAGDTLVLSSDGLHDYVTQETMCMAGEALTAEESASFLMEAAAKTSNDNITLIVVRVHGKTIPQEECD
ncbi:protein phosphatase 2C domain-containing protein [Methanogenium marinum]|uniref:Protein phosphatase 2C domain-containing protein n=1 Tax=Methanogenium marinum TaxID=348610 RepID=A0A9Q4KUU6_9EURY|nr:protein phosphatase 2C domain-containing protein [Methanogenium marinum]MDE4907716.1 protein phosphatase 2C domain-containing protein [Methanogenium marinum]